MSSFLVSSSDSLFLPSSFTPRRSLANSLSLLRDSGELLVSASAVSLLGTREMERESEQVRGSDSARLVETSMDCAVRERERETESESLPALRRDLRWSGSSGDEAAASREEEDQVAYEAFAAAISPTYMTTHAALPSLTLTQSAAPVPAQGQPVARGVPVVLPGADNAAPCTDMDSDKYSDKYSDNDSDTEEERPGRKPVAYGTRVSLAGLQMDAAAPEALRRVRLTKLHLLCVSLETMDEFMCKCEQELAQPPITAAEQRELRRQRRLVRNRIYAAESRKRKRREIAREKSDLSTLRAENDGLRARVRELEAALAVERGQVTRQAGASSSSPSSTPATPAGDGRVKRNRR